MSLKPQRARNLMQKSVHQALVKPHLGQVNVLLSGVLKPEPHAGTWAFWGWFLFVGFRGEAVVAFPIPVLAAILFHALTLHNYVLTELSDRFREVEV